MERQYYCVCCGVEFKPTCHISRQKYCNEACRIKHNNAKRYFGAQVKTCPNCGEEVKQTGEQGHFRRFCDDRCRAAYCIKNPKIPPKRTKGHKSITFVTAEQWKERLKAKAHTTSCVRTERQRVWLVCGDTSMYIGLDGLLAIIEHTLLLNPFDGSLYVFCDMSRTMLKYLEWDGSSFCLTKRRAQSGSYPWPPSEAGTVIEISEKEFLFLRSKSIIQAGQKKL